MKLPPLGRTLWMALALAVAAPGAAHARHAAHAEGALRPGTEAVHWLRHDYGPWLTTGETEHWLELMARDPASFFAGGIALFEHDLAGAWARFAEPPGPQVLRVGDAGVKNLGPMRDGRGQGVFDWLSYDHAVKGGALNDVRALLVSLVLLGRELALDDSDVSGVLLETMRTYRDALERITGTWVAREWAMTAERANPLVRRLLNAASHRRREDLLDRWTVVGHQGRRFKLEGEFAPVEPYQAQAWTAALLSMKTEARPASYWLVKDSVVRSYDGTHRGPHHAVYLLIEGPTASLVDDFILEATIPPQPARYVQWAAWQARRAPEPFFGVVNVGGQAYELREVQPEEVAWSEADISGLDDVYDLGRAAALVLARQHAVTAASAQEVRQFTASWAADPRTIESELGHFAFRYAEQVVADQIALAAHFAPHHTIAHVIRRHHHTHVAVDEAPSKPVKIFKPGEVAPPASAPDLPQHEGHKESAAPKPAASPAGPPPAPATPALPPPTPGTTLAPPDEGK